MPVGERTNILDENVPTVPRYHTESMVFVWSAMSGFLNDSDICP